MAHRKQHIGKGNGQRWCTNKITRSANYAFVLTVWPDMIIKHHKAGFEVPIDYYKHSLCSKCARAVWNAQLATERNA